jgi:hypothetical protein
MVNEHGMFQITIESESRDFDIWYDIYLTAIGLTPGGSNTAHI